MSVTARIKSWTIRRKMSEASWIWDLVNLQRTLALCKGCSTQRMPWRWQQKLHYQEMRTLHGDGPLRLLSQGRDVSRSISRRTQLYFQRVERDHTLATAAQERDRALVFDRRRVF